MDLITLHNKPANTRLRWARLIAVIAMLLAVPSGGLEAADPGERIGDWFYNCDADTNTAKGPCYITQTSEKKLPTETVRLVTANIGYLFNDKKIWLVTLFPLRSWHLDIQQPLTIDVDGNQQISGKIDTCFESGCRARFVLNRNILTAFIKGNAAGVSFKVITGKPIRLELSLKGIAKALRTL